MKHILYSLFFILMVSCENPNTPKVIVEASSLLEKKPDSAYVILKNEWSGLKNFNRRNRMHYLMTYAEAMNKAYIPMDTISFMDEVLRYYNSNGSEIEKMNASYMMGCVYRDKGDCPSAIKFYLKAVELADTVKSVSELPRIYGQIASLFHEQRMPQEEMYYWNMARKYALMCSDTLMAIQSKERCIGAYLLWGNKSKALKVAKEVYNEYKQIGRKDYAAASLGIQIDNNIENKHLDSAKMQITDYVLHSGLFSNGELIQGHEFFYYYLGRYYKETLNLDSSLYYYRKLASRSTDINSQENAYRGLMEDYAQLNEIDSVVKYANLFTLLNDSANVIHSADEINKAQSLYNYSEKQKVADQKATEAKLYHFYCILLILLLIIIVVATCFLINSRKKKRKQELRGYNLKYMEILQQYYAALEELRKLEVDVEKSKRDKEDQINRLSTILSSYTGKFLASDKEAERYLMEHTTVLQFHKYASTIKRPTNIEWEELYDIVKVSLSKFYDFIDDKNFSLSEQERKVCILTRLHFIPSEISVLLDISKQRMTNLRAKLNKTLFGDVGSKTFTPNIYKIGS